MAYLLDANVLMEAKNRYYGFDFCPAFWDWLIQANAEEKVFSIEKVSDEIKAGDDRLTEWAVARGDQFFVKPTPPVAEKLGQVADWVKQQGYDTPAITTFMEKADCYLVAHALADKHDLVTLEVASSSRKRIKIPNVCIGLGIKCLTPFDMLGQEKVRFILKTTS